MKIYRPYRVGDGLRRFPPGLNQSARSQPRNHAARLLNIPLHTHSNQTAVQVPGMIFSMGTGVY